MPFELTTTSSVRQGMIVPLLIWLPLAMIVVFLTQSGLVKFAAQFLLVLLLVLRIASPIRRRQRAMLSGCFNGEVWLSYVRDAFALIAIVVLIFPIFLTLSSDARYLTFDEQYLVSEGLATTYIVTVALDLWFVLPILFALFCLCVKPEGGTATAHRLLFLVYLIAAFFIFEGVSGWVVESMHLLSLNISGKELLDPASATLHVVLLSIVALVAFYCYYKISIVLFEHLVTKGKKFQLRRLMFTIFNKGLLENKSVAEDKLDVLKLSGVTVGVMIITGAITILALYIYWG